MNYLWAPCVIAADKAGLASRRFRYNQVRSLAERCHDYQHARARAWR